MTEPINIHEHVAAICRQLDLEPTNVGKLVIRHLDVKATIYKRDANGAKYVENDAPATETRTFKVIA